MAAQLVRDLLGFRSEIGQRVQLSEGDIRQAKKLYNCGGDFVVRLKMPSRSSVMLPEFLPVGSEALTS